MIFILFYGCTFSHLTSTSCHIMSHCTAIFIVHRAPFFSRSFCVCTNKATASSQKWPAEKGSFSFYSASTAADEPHCIHPRIGISLLCISYLSSSLQIEVSVARKSWRRVGPSKPELSHHVPEWCAHISDIHTRNPSARFHGTCGHVSEDPYQLPSSWHSDMPRSGALLGRPSHF